MNIRGAIISDDKQNRLAALRQRVRSKLIDSRIASRKREQQAEQEIVVKAPKVEEVGFLELDDQELTEGEKRRRLASALVMIGFDGSPIRHTYSARKSFWVA